jgi:hypothetical protein
VAATTTSTLSASPDVSVACSGHSPRASSSSAASSQFITTRMLALPVAVPHSCCRCATQSGPTAAPPELLLPHSAPAAVRGTSGGVPGARAASTPCRNAACARA